MLPPLSGRNKSGDLEGLESLLKASFSDFSWVSKHKMGLKVEGVLASRSSRIQFVRELKAA